MSTRYKKLFEPLTVGKLTIKNRIAMAPLGMVAMADPCGGFSENAQEYYIERAKGGTGLIITGITNVNYNELVPLVMPCASYQPLMFAKSCALMNERIHAYDSKIFLQHTGGFGRVAIPHLMKNAIAPSEQENRWDASIQHRAMTIDEIKELIASFVTCAVIAKESKFDGVEIHAVHEGYLLDQFAIALYNKRTDEYGGDLFGRLKISIDIVKGIKAACGKDFPVSLRYSLKSFVKAIRKGALPGEDFVEKGKDIDEGIEAAKILVKAGYDLLNVDAGTYDSWYWNHPPMYFEKGMYRKFGKILKENVNVPIILAGRMDDPDIACEALGTSCDIVAYGRPLLADPYLPEKIRTEKLEDIRPCLSCHQGCLDRLAHGLPLSCAVNPACGREKALAITLATEKKKVLIIGGGLAGMEAARVCAIRGHQVILMEKNNKLGGNIIPGSVPDFKKDDRALLKWYVVQLEKLPVEIKLNYTANREMIGKSNVDVVIFATGSTPVKIDFGNKNRIYTADDILKNKENAREDIVVVGGGLVGCETALWLRYQGKNVTIVEAKAQILGGGEDMCFANYDMLKDLLIFNKIDVYSSSSIKTINDDSVMVATPNGEKEIKADTVIVSVGYHSEKSLYETMLDSNKIVYNVGDSRKVHNIMYAIWDAFEVASNI
ncbi:FAD-dependent oxidoreductase [Acetobacterium tundrae]|uniref:FAD-dependent oxidoreductase n=1 Tax=Acetobacterium tundrae TaxID=132932 RepID=A0ABR6WQK7_9FIRM|nr:FAD-dependent oxidoreductase [Acetobacterium tundrae]MBC3798641.1 FAD-dependent oxidoreductase [Acetobacterium tundrae]